MAATTKKGHQIFVGKKCIQVTWLEDFLTLKWPGSFTALAPPLNFLLNDIFKAIVTLKPWFCRK